MIIRISKKDKSIDKYLPSEDIEKYTRFRIRINSSKYTRSLYYDTELKQVGFLNKYNIFTTCKGLQEFVNK